MRASTLEIVLGLSLVLIPGPPVLTFSVPYSIDAAVATIEREADTFAASGTRLIALGGDHTLPLPLLRAVAKRHGPVAVIHFDAHLDTWDTLHGAPVWHGSPFRRAAEEGLLDPGRCVHVGLRGGVYDRSELEADEVLGFATLRGLTGLGIVGSDLVEVAPAYDHAQLTGLAAAHTVWEILAVMAHDVQHH